AARLRIDPTVTPAAEALAIASDIFRLRRSPALDVLREYVDKWAQKPITRTGTLAEFLEYLGWLEEHNRDILLPEAREEAPVIDAVRLMTAHVAKGLEFTEVFVLRANSNSFPTSYHAALFDLPIELRARMSAEQEGE